MRNLSRNGSGQGNKLEEASWQNNYMLGPFIREKISRGLHRTQRNHLYEYGLHKTRTARINGSRLSSRPDRSNDDVGCSGA